MVVVVAGGVTVKLYTRCMLKCNTTGTVIIQYSFYMTLYRVIHEDGSVFLDVIVSVILRKYFI